MKNIWFKIFISCIFFLGLSTYLTYPLIFHFTDSVTSLGDELLIIWIQNWVIHSLQTNIWGIFQANIFYPYHNSLAFSETFITTSVLAYLPYLLTKQPVITLNFTLFTSTFLFGFSVYLLCFYVTKKNAIALVCGTLAICSPVVLDKSVHLQVLSISFVLFALLAYIAFLKRKKISYFLLFLFFFLLQVYNSFLPGYFIICSSVILTYFFVQYKKASITIFWNKYIVISTLFCVMLCLPVIVPYYQVSKEFNFVRDIRESIHLGLQPEDLLYGSQYTRLAPFLTKNLSFLHQSTIELKNGYLGVVLTLLSIIAVGYGCKKWKKKDPLSNGFLSIALFGLILSFGPFLHLGRHTIHTPFPIPLPYALFYALAPGFKGFRNAARWEMLFVIGITVVIAIMLSDFLKNKTKIVVCIILFSLLVGTVIEYDFPRHLQPIPSIPKVNQWLTTRLDTSVVIEMPIYAWYMHPYATQELFRDYYSVSNFLPLVNGASGYSPIPWEKNSKQLMIEFPYEPSFVRMKKIGINYIIFHKNEFDMLNKNNFMIDSKRIDDGETILNQLKNNRNVTLVKEFPGDYVFKINYD